VTLPPELISVCAEYAATLPLRWSASAHALQVRPSGPLDGDGCSRVLADEGRSAGWQAALSHEPLSTFPVDSDGRVRWGCRLALSVSRCVVGVARARHRCSPICGALTIVRGECAFLRGEGERSQYSTEWETDRRVPLIVWCAVDLRAGTVSYVFEDDDGKRRDLPFTPQSVPQLRECFAYAAQTALSRSCRRQRALAQH
jgi:hypothetical protein